MPTSYQQPRTVITSYSIHYTKLYDSVSVFICLDYVFSASAAVHYSDLCSGRSSWRKCIPFQYNNALYTAEPDCVRDYAVYKTAGTINSDPLPEFAFNRSFLIPVADSITLVLYIFSAADSKFNLDLRFFEVDLQRYKGESLFINLSGSYNFV